MSVGRFQGVARTEICSCICKNVQGRQEKQVPSQNLAKRNLKPSLKLPFRIQGTSSAWDTSRAGSIMLPGLVMCEVHPTTAHTTFSALSTPYSVLSWHLPPERFLHLSPLPTLCFCVIQSNPRSDDLIKYSCWTEYFFCLCHSIDPSIHWITYRVDRWQFSQRGSS